MYYYSIATISFCILLLFQVTIVYVKLYRYYMVLYLCFSAYITTFPYIYIYSLYIYVEISMYISKRRYAIYNVI